MALVERENKLLEEIARLETKVADLLPHSVYLVDLACQKLTLRSYRFFSCPTDYYDWPLENRRNFLGARSVDQLCKSLLFQNTKHQGEDEPTNSQFYLVIVQYTKRFAGHKLFQYVRSLKQKAPQAAYHFEFASEEDSARLTGFDHNGVAPFATTHPLPVIIDRSIVNLPQDAAFLGGGHKDFKLLIKVSEVLSKCNWFVADITHDQ